MRYRRAIVRYSIDGLGTALGLPNDTRIRQVIYDPERPDTLSLVVEGPNCPLIHEGEAYPWVGVESL